MNKQHDVDILRAEIFCKYLKEKYDWTYVPTHPKVQSVPDVDILLISSEGRAEIKLQLTEPRKWEGKLLNEIPYFSAGLFSHAIERKTLKYKEQNADINELILILFDSIRPETVAYDIDVSQFQQSEFRGIYIVSPGFEYNLHDQRGRQRQESWVYVVKDAFK